MHHMEANNAHTHSLTRTYTHVNTCARVRARPRALHERRRRRRRRQRQRRRPQRQAQRLRRDRQHRTAHTRTLAHTHTLAHSHTPVCWPIEPNRVFPSVCAYRFRTDDVPHRHNARATRSHSSDSCLLGACPQSHTLHSASSTSLRFASDDDAAKISLASAE